MKRHVEVVGFVVVLLAMRSSASAACISDTDGDGVCDNVDICPDTVPGATVDSEGCPPVIAGDYDRDGDVDFFDLGIFSACRSGPAVPASLPCQTGYFDFDFDTDVDHVDYAVFQRCISAEGLPADPDCAPHQARIEDGCLQITGTPAGESLALRLAPGLPTVLHVDVGNDGAPDFSFDRSQFTCIVIHAGSGDDTVVIDEVNGIFTDTEATTIYGDDGNDTLLGGSGGETFVGGLGDDSANLGAGDDHFTWNHGDGTDVVDDTVGIDMVEVNGSGSGENFTVTANGIRVRFDRISPDPFFLDIGGCENLVLNANGGNDSLACTGNLAALIQITADGGAGEDTLLGSNGTDVLIGGDDNDFIDGNQGADVVFLGAGDDVFQWDPGDGNDTVEGQADHDTIRFNGSNTAEIFDFSANGQRLRFTRNVGNIVLDADDVEQFDLQPLGGSDLAIVNDLTGTDVSVVNVDFDATFGGGTGDALADSVAIIGSPGADVFSFSADAGYVVVNRGADVRVKGYEFSDQILVDGVGGDVVIVNGSEGADTMSVIADGTRARIDVTGYSAAVSVSGALSLTVNGLGGPDSISCTGNLGGLLIPLTLDGGAGEDTVLGSNGADLLIGGDDNDLVDGNQGADVAFLGAGDDVFQWDPGDGNDTVEGQADHDTIRFNGSNTAESFVFSANGQRLRFTRDVANIVLDADDVEQFDLQALGGTDTATVNDLAGTDVSQVNIDLAGTLGGGSGDGLIDNVIVNGTSGEDNLVVAGGITGPLVTGLSAVVTILRAEAANDRLTVNGLGANDNLQATGLPSGVIGLTLNGGTGDDVLVGSAGADLLNGDDDNDTITGGDNNDTIQGGFGNDHIIWNPGDDTDVIDGNDGIDTVEVNGGNGAEEFTVTANGTRVRFDRINPAPFFLDIGTCENLVLNANGGNDSLACTGNLAALIQITADGGAGEDTLLGSNGADVLIGGDDNDFIDGNQGADVAFLGAGDDVFQWDPGDGNDTVEGQADYDTIRFNGSNTAEIYDFQANGGRLRFTRNVGNVVLDADDVEQFDLQPLGGADIATVNDLAGTDVSEVNIDLAGTLGGVTGDAQVDSVTVNGTAGPDVIHVSANAGAVIVDGLAAQVAITHSEAANDSLTVNGLGAVDTITFDPGVILLIMLSINQ